MKSQTVDPFGTIESAHDFMTLLAAAASQAKAELQVDVDRESRSADLSRRVEALRIALYNLEKLELHLNRSNRILNDLRTLRRLLFEEKTMASSEPRSVSRVGSQAVAQNNHVGTRKGIAPLPVPSAVVNPSPQATSPLQSRTARNVAASVS